MKNEINKTLNRFYRLTTAEFQREIEKASDAQRTALLLSAHQCKDGEVELRMATEVS